MSELGHKRPTGNVRVMSAFAPKADIFAAPRRPILKPSAGARIGKSPLSLDRFLGHDIGAGVRSASGRNENLGVCRHFHSLSLYGAWTCTRGVTKCVLPSVRERHGGSHW